LLIRNGERLSGWFAARLPKGLATFVSFYEAWLTRLREREPSTWRFRRPVIVMVIDSTVVVAIVISASTLGPRLLADFGLTGIPATLILVGSAIVIAAPFALGAIRRAAMIARRLAAEVIPSTGSAVDLGRAPRQVLVLVLELAIALAIAVPAVAATQPFVPASPLIVGLGVLAALLLVRRSMADFEGHVRAGSELVLEFLSTASHTEQPAQPAVLAQMQAVLPGFAGVTPFALVATSPAIGRSLAELDLRRQRTVLAIGRGDHGLATPSPTEPLRAGDILALAGSDAAIAAARQMLDPTLGPTVEQHAP
jgi:CPA2 family monovalent cation:H+ antiporter-2